MGPGLTTTPVDQQVVDRIRAHTANPAHAAAAAVQLFTGTTLKELKTIPCVAFAIDALIYAGPIGVADPAPLCVWPVPPASRPLLEAALLFQTTRPEPSDKLLTGGIGALGQILHETLTTAGLLAPARHAWHYGWLWQTGTLWCGRRPIPPKRTHIPAADLGRERGNDRGESAISPTMSPCWIATTSSGRAMPHLRTLRCAGCSFSISSW